MPYIPGRREHRKPDDGDAGDKKANKPALPGDIDVVKLKKAYDDLEKAHHEIKESYVEMILRLAIAAEYKDSDTGGHILRISDYATELAKEIGLPVDEIEALRYASPMHDMGKIGVPDRILQKPGKLDEEEWAIMKQHTIFGARIFQNSKSPILQAASTIALTHHEKYDGSGYPAGLKGEAIPIFGRIVALVDVFDAMISERCYKKGMSFDAAFNYVKSLGGTHLDPKLVEIFVRIRPRIEQIFEAHTSIQKFVDEGEELKEDKS